MEKCLFCQNNDFITTFEYNKPPIKEVIYNDNILKSYYRKVICCTKCGHYYSMHDMNLSNLYSGNYNQSIYVDLNGMHETFKKISNLDEDKSDNSGRCDYINSQLNNYYAGCSKSEISILDIGSGLGIFPWKMSLLGYSVTGYDPDPNAVNHLTNYLKLTAILGDYLKDNIKTKYTLITLNKVLEHVIDPVLMLKKTLNNLKKEGLVYVELPDGEVASKYGSDREEFTIDHLHIFSFTSFSKLIDKSGFEAIELKRIEEPSSKYTLRAIMRIK